MEKEKFNLNVKETDNGYIIEVTGEGAKDFLKEKINVCCGDGSSFTEMMKHCRMPAG